MNQPKRRLGLPLTCALIGFVVLAIVATALHRGSSTTSQPISEATHQLVNASGRQTLSTSSDQPRQLSFSNLPVAFEPNLGQTDPQVKYLARGNGYTLFLTSNEAVLSLEGGSEAGFVQSQTSRAHVQLPATKAILRMRLVDANAQPQAESSSILPGVTNYFIGNDPSRWHAKIPTYARVVYRNVYPGTDLAVYGTLHEPNFEFAVAPEANPSRIRLLFADAENAETDASGNLVLSLPGGTVSLRKPLAHQGNNSSQSPIDVRFVVTPEKQVGLRLGSYDRASKVVIDYGFGASKVQHTVPDSALTQTASTLRTVTVSKSTNGLLFFALLPIAGLAIAGVGFIPRRHKLLGCLLISLSFSGLVFMMACGGGGGGGGGKGGGGGGGGTGPTLAYSTYMGGGSDDKSQGIAVDSVGNVYVTGSAGDASFPTTTGPTFAGPAHDAFVAKLSSTGAVAYATFIGGNGDDRGVSIVVDSSGNAFVAGNTQFGSLFPTTTTLGPVFGQDCFVAEFDSNGARTFSTVIGGGSADTAEGIAIDSSGIYLTGETFSTDLFSNPIRAFGGGTEDGFAAKLNSNGTSLIYSTYIGGSNQDLATGIAVDGSNNAYVSGITASSGLGTNGSVFGGGVEDAFVVKLDSTGNQAYFTYLGGSAADDANGITVNKTSGVAFVTGRTLSSDFPHPGTPFQGSLKGTQDAFVTKLNADGTIGFSTYLGGAGAIDEGLAIAIDASSNVYVTGVTDSADFPLKNPLTGSTALSGANDAFVTELAASGSTEVFSTYFGGSGSEDKNLISTTGVAGGIAVDTAGKIYITGSTNSSSGFPLLNAAHATYGGGTADGFIAKINP